MIAMIGLALSSNLVNNGYRHVKRRYEFILFKEMGIQYITLETYSIVQFSPQFLELSTSNVG